MAEESIFVHEQIYVSHRTFKLHEIQCTISKNIFTIISNLFIYNLVSMTYNMSYEILISRFSSM